MSSSSNNTLWANNFFNNGKNEAYCEDSAGNQWSHNGVGNYYGNYTDQNPNSINNGFVWDIPYQIDGNLGEKDYYPLVNLSIDDSDGDGLNTVEECRGKQFV